MVLIYIRKFCFLLFFGMNYKRMVRNKNTYHACPCHIHLQESGRTTNFLNLLFYIICACAGRGRRPFREIFQTKHIASLLRESWFWVLAAAALRGHAHMDSQNGCGVRGPVLVCPKFFCFRKAKCSQLQLNCLLTK